MRRAIPFSRMYMQRASVSGMGPNPGASQPVKADMSGMT